MDDEELVELTFEVEALDHHFGDAATGVLIRQCGRRAAAGDADRGRAGSAELRVGREVRGPYVVELVIDDQVETLDVEASPGRRGVHLGARRVLVLQADMADIEEDRASDRRVLTHIGRNGGRSADATGQNGGREDSLAHFLSS